MLRSESSAARRDRTCLGLLVEQVSSLDGQRRSSWITRESNTVRAPYQRAQGNQPVVILSRNEGCEDDALAGPTFEGR